MPVEKSFHAADPKILSLLKKVMPFSDLTEVDLISVAQILKKYEYSEGEIVIREGDTGSTAYIVSGGIFDLDIMGQQVRKFETGDFFGEIALIDARPRMGTVTSSGESSLLMIEGPDLENKNLINPEIAMKIYRGFSRLITSYVREGSNLYKEMEVLLIQDGGCAPGYNPVTAFISEDLEKSGFKVYICAEGFCSLVSDKPLDYRRLVYDTEEYHRLEHLPGVIFSPPLRESRGADFRSERFPEFQQQKIQKLAAENVISRNVKV